MRRSATASCVMALLFLVLTSTGARAATPGTWRRTTTMLAGRGWFGAAVADDLLFAVGGDGRGSIEAYKASTRTWRFHAALPDARDWFAVASVNNRVYAFGGLVHGA